MKYNLLSEKQTKLDKSVKHGHLSVVLHLEPAYTDKDSGVNTCPNAGQCKAYCLAYSGRMRFPIAQAARIRRTKMFFKEREAFMAMLFVDILKARRHAADLNLPLTIRLNGTSDIEWEHVLWNQQTLMETFPDVQFIDYTKNIERTIQSLNDPRWPKNYKLVYSKNEKTDDNKAAYIVHRGGNVAVVFDIKKTEPLPSDFWLGFQHFPVFDGDTNDLRHLDPAGHIVGLRYKPSFKTKTGKMLQPKKGFIVLS